MNHSFPGLSGTSAPTSRSDACNAFSRAEASSVRKTSPTAGRRERDVRMPWPNIRWIASRLDVRPILHSQTSRPSSSASRRSFGLKYKYTHWGPSPISLSGRMTGSISLISSSIEGVVSVAPFSVTVGPSGEEPAQRHQPCPGLITSPSSLRSLSTRLMVKLGLATAEPPRSRCDRTTRSTSSPLFHWACSRNSPSIICRTTGRHERKVGWFCRRFTSFRAHVRILLSLAPAAPGPNPSMLRLLFMIFLRHGTPRDRNR
jgi:hypothetical protein